MHILKKFYFFIMLVLWMTCAATANAYQLSNYLGTGTPRLKLELGTNGPKWNSYVIDYQNSGTLPWGTNMSQNWSAWNIKDTDGNYYGTLTLANNKSQPTFKSYQGGEGFYLEGINFSCNGANCQLTADKIHTLPNDGPFPLAPLATDTQTSTVLSVQKDLIIDNKGHPVTLKGMVRPSLEWNKQGEHLSEADIKNMKKWGINVIRLDLNQHYWFSSAPKTQKGSYKQIIDAMIYYAIQNDMAIILDLHWSEDGHQSAMANKKSIEFWQQVAAEYKNFGTVIFELFNEPNGISKEVWLHGDATFAGYQTLYNAIRSVGAKNICIVNGLDYGYDLSFVNDQFRVQGDNIVYGSHPYNEKGETANGFAPDFSGVIGKYPLIFTEFGVNQNRYFPTEYKRVYNNLLYYINKNHIHYTAFAWWVETNNPAFPAIIENWEGKPLNGGQNIQDDLKNYPPSGLGH